MRSRATSIRVIFLTLGLFLAAFSIAMTDSRPAAAQWGGFSSFGCPGGRCTLEQACQSFANYLSQFYGNMTVQQIIMNPPNAVGSPNATCRLSPRFPALEDHWDQDTALACPSGQLYNTGRALGCQPWEEPEGFGGCPTCGAGTGSSSGPGAPGGSGPGGSGGQVSGGGDTGVGDPITLSNGNKFHAVTDYRSSGPDPLEFKRYYNALNWVGPNYLGWGWRHNFRATLHIYSSTGIWAHRPDGRIENFTSATGANPWNAVKGGVVGKLAKTPTGWTYTRPDDTVETYDASGKLLSIAKKNGYTQTIDYAVGGVSGVWGITDSHGRTLTLYHTYYGNPVGWRLTRMVDPDGRVYSYEYQGVNSYNQDPLVLNKVVYPDDTPDPPASYGVTLLTHLDGPDGATTAADESASGHTLTFNGTAQIDTAQSRFGGASALFDGTNTTYISAPDSEDWNFGAGPFTIEEWVQFSSTAAYSTPLRQFEGSGKLSWAIDWTTTNQIRFHYSIDGVSYVTNAATWTPTIGAWHHIVVDRDSSSRLRLYVDGNVLIDTVVTATFFNSSANLRIGERHNGWIDEVRITKGVALYGGAFVPPNQPLTTTPDARLNNPFVTYQYEDSRFGYGLTGITDETGQRIATWSYNAQGRGLSSKRAAGTDAVAITYNPDGTKTVSNPLGKDFKYTFSTVALLPRITRIDRLASASTPAAAMTFQYDAKGLINQKTDWNGNITKYVHDSRGLQTSRTEAFGTPEERTITTAWDPTYRVPTQITEPERTTTFTYYPDGLLHTRTVTDTTSHVVPYSTNGETRTWTYTYNAQGLVETVDGPRTDVADVTTYAYDPVTGDLVSVTDALGHVTQITQRDASGRPLKTLDANGVETTLAYDARGRLLSRIVDSGAGGTPATTSFAYDPAGTMTGMTLPDNSTLTYEYDAADRLTAIENDFGERIEYTYDLMGNRTGQTVKASDLSIVRTAAATFDDLGQMLKSLGAYAGEETAYAWDANGNRISVTDPLNNVTQSDFDALNRLVTVTDALLNAASYGYDSAGNRDAATDQRSLTTSYVHNGFGEVIQQSSPDTGATVFEYDSAGNRVRRTDARGVVTEWTYDALGRVAAMNFPASPAEDVTYTYDDATPGHYGIGRLASVTDDSGSTAYRYDARGNTVRVDSVVGAQAYVAEYGYDSADRLVQMTYPSGRIVDYLRDAIGRVTSVTTKENGAAPAVTLASGGSYEPFGPLDGLTWGNGVTLALGHDLDGRITAIEALDGAMPVLDLDYALYDLAGNIRTITDAAGTGRDRSYVYDDLHRLTDASGGIPTETYTYDEVGNRTGRTVATASETYAYDAASNRLLSVTGAATRSLTYSDSGNTSQDDKGGGTVLDYAYDSTDRLVAVTQGAATVADYLHNAVGQRVAKTVGGATTHFLYDLSGRLIGETDGATGAATAEYIWLEGMPLAFVTGGAVYYVHADHLGTPQRLTDGAKAVVWDAAYAPFGQATVSGSVTFNLRFPGQYDDVETGLHYNYFRDYDPALGRYVQSDPIGLVGGWNNFAYVGGNPVILDDRLGLRPTARCSLSKPIFIESWLEEKDAMEVKTGKTRPIFISYTYDELDAKFSPKGPWGRRGIFVYIQRNKLYRIEEEMQKYDLYHYDAYYYRTCFKLGCISPGPETDVIIKNIPGGKYVPSGKYWKPTDKTIEMFDAIVVIGIVWNS